MVLLLILTTICLTSGVKILQFKHKRTDDGSKILKTAGTNRSVSSLSFCIDFDLKLVKYSRIIHTPGFEDLEIIVPDTLDRFYTKVKGVWYLTPSNIDPYSFSTYCMSYNAVDHEVTFAFNGEVIFEKKDPTLLGGTTFSKDFPSNIMIGFKEKAYTFTGDITRLNIWSQPFSNEQLKIKSSCDGLDDELQDVGVPDLLNWETTDWDEPEGALIKEYKAYPCNSQQVETLDVLMPYAAVDFFDAIETCNVLGGKMAPPKSAEDMRRMITEAGEDEEKSDCLGYMWLPYMKNIEDVWAHYDGTEDSLLPEFWKEPPWLQWEKGQPNGLHLEKCASIIIGENIGIFDDDCKTSNYCYMCEFEDITYFNIRGLCSNLKNILDSSYLVDMEKVSQNIGQGVIWTGYRKSNILFNKTLNRWTITPLGINSPILTLANEVYQ